MKREIIDSLKDTINIEAKAITGLLAIVDNSFVDVVQKLHTISGKIIITGIGKSAIIAQKIVATLNSTGSRSLFLHAADAIHGDLGIISKEDIVVCISKSGETEEIKYLASIIQSMDVEIIAMTSNANSFLAQKSNYHIYIPIEKEADPNNLAPTASTTAQLVIGDAIAVALLELKGFNSENFALLHPGGNLGKMLYTKVGDLCFNNEVPSVNEKANVNKVIIEISKGRLGATAVINDNEELLGIITDGDLRRMLLSDSYNPNTIAFNIMTENPKTINYDALAVEAMELMKSLSITQLLVLRENKYAGIIHIHDLIKEGIV